MDLPTPPVREYCTAIPYTKGWIDSGNTPARDGTENWKYHAYTPAVERRTCLDGRRTLLELSMQKSERRAA